MSQQPPNPFSREGSGPEDGLGVAGSGSESAGSSSNPWPTSAGSGSDWPGSAGSPTAGPHDSSADEWPVAGTTPNPYSAGSPPPVSPWPSYPGSAPEAGTPYGSPYPSSAGSAPGFDPQPTPPYGATGGADYGSPYSAPSYGDNPYEVNPYQPTYGSYSPYGGVPATQHPQAVLAMILGIVGVAACSLVGIAGLVLGNKARKEIDAEPGRYSGRGMATAGFVLGIVSVCFSVFWVLFIVLGASGALDS
jgi:hypothetical protein